jgi:hypothetical protein
LLRVITEAADTTIELTSVESSLWHSGRSEASTARRFTHRDFVAPNCAARFWTELDAMLLAPFNAEETAGLDGISIEVDCRTPAGNANFEVWSPEPTTRAGKLVGLIYDIAWKTSSAASAVERLEHLHGYLRAELPARIIDGSITRLRLFGSLTTCHQDALRQLFAGLPYNGPLLIDMTNCGGMGTAFVQCVH